MNMLIHYASGLLFALGLGVSGMTQPEKVIAFLDFFGNWDPSLIFVMGGAVGINMLLYRLTLHRPCPVYAEQFTMPRQRKISGHLIVGAALFGIGWGLGGYCPGPAQVSLASGDGSVVVFVIAMLAGMWLHEKLQALHEDDDVITQQD